MRKNSILLALCMLTICINVNAQTLTSLYPAKFYTQSEPTVSRLTINGKDMWPDVMTITMTIQLMKIHFKKNGRDEVIRGVGISKDRQVVEFVSTNWLSTPGPVEVYITTDAFSGYPEKRSNSLWLQVESTPASAPVINDLSNRSFQTGLSRDKYYLRVYGKNFGEERSTYASIGGIATTAGWQHLVDGVMDIWVPTELINKPGTYPVVVHTKYGQSNPVDLKIEMPVAKPGQSNTVSNIKINSQVKPVTIKPAVQSINQVDLSTDAKNMVGVQLLKGIRVTMNGVVVDGPTKSTLENFISSQANVFSVDNQLQVMETNGNININLKGSGVDKAEVDKVKTAIESKAASMKLSVAVSIQ